MSNIALETGGLWFNSGWMETAEPMTRERAQELARSYKVTLQLDGEERVIDFSEARLGDVRPVFYIRR